MKKRTYLLAFALLMLTSGFYLIVSNKHLMFVNSVAELKQRLLTNNNVVFVAGKSTIGDGLGAFYYFDSLATDAEDMVFLNVIKSDVSSLGAWKRLNARNQLMPGGGLLVSNGGVKEYMTTHVSGTGSFTVNLTTDNTATGTAIFTDIRNYSCQVVAPAPSTASDAITAYPKGVSADKKSLTYGIRYPQALVSVVGISVLSANSSAATSVTCNCTTKGL